jgi:hypothetical protein
MKKPEGIGSTDPHITILGKIELTERRSVKKAIECISRYTSLPSRNGEPVTTGQRRKKASSY